MKINTIVFLLIFLLVLIVGCDQNSPFDAIGETTTQIFNDVPRSSMKDKIDKIGGTRRYTCSVSTLNKEGSIRRFQNQSSVQLFSDEVESLANDNKVSFVFVFTGV
jgi:hypothetical protein